MTTPKTHDRQAMKDFMERLAVDLGAKPPEGMHVHITRRPENCKHEWDNEGCNPEYCLKCGMSLMAHAMMECL